MGCGAGQRLLLRGRNGYRDANGVVRVPPAAAARVAEEAENVLSTEEGVFRLMQEGPLPLEELNAKFFRHD
jgi:regulator of RNase E activity RraA